MPSSQASGRTAKLRKLSPASFRANEHHSLAWSDGSAVHIGANQAAAVCLYPIEGDVMPARPAGFWRPGGHQDSAQTCAEKQKKPESQTDSGFLTDYQGRNDTLCG